MGQNMDDLTEVNGFNGSHFDFPQEEEIEKLLDAEFASTYSWDEFPIPFENLVPDNITLLIQADDKAQTLATDSLVHLSDVINPGASGSAVLTNGELPVHPILQKKRGRKPKRKAPTRSDSCASASTKKIKPGSTESHTDKPVPKLIIKMTSLDRGEVKKPVIEAELFAPSIADKVKLGRRVTGNVNDKDFKTFLKDSEKLLKKPRKKGKIEAVPSEGSSKSQKIEGSSMSSPLSSPKAVKVETISKRIASEKDEFASFKAKVECSASQNLSMPVISDLLSFSSTNITTTEEPGEVSSDTSHSPSEEKCKRSVSSSSDEVITKSSMARFPERAGRYASTRTSNPPLRYSFPDTPSCSPQISPIYSSPGMSGSSKYKSRRLSSSSDSSETSSSSSSTYSRRQSIKTRSEKHDYCPRCQNPPYHKAVKYNPSNNTVTDEFGRELRPHEQKIYEASCHCSLLGFPKIERNYTRQLKHSKNQRKTYRSTSRSRSRSRNRMYTRNSSREPQRSPSTTKHSNPRERDRPIEERRVLYVGDIPCGMTETALHDRFINFGPIEDVHIKSKFTNHVQKYFGFITFKHREDAYNAKENGNKDPKLPKFDLNFGGRRKFCNGNYTDLDGNIAKAEDRRYYDYPKKTMPMSKDLEFEELLQMEKQRIQAKGLAIRSPIKS